LLLGAASIQAQETLFTFRNEFWLNLHHFLYVLGRARNGVPDARREAVRHAPEDVEGMEALDRAQLLEWDAAVTYYRKTLSTKDAVFDNAMVDVTRPLATGRLDVPAELRRVLERAAPIYRKVWWPRHEQSNRDRIRELDALVRAHGRPIAAAVAKAWREKWPAAAIPVNVSAYSNWAGAYSTDGIIVMGSRNREASGTLGLEILFHETMHIWDDDFQKRIAQAATEADAPMPRSLSHSLIFFTAGYAVAAEIPGHTPYADANGVWGRGLFSRDRIQTEWVPYLRGQRSMEEALRKLVNTSP